MYIYMYIYICIFDSEVTVNLETAAAFGSLFLFNYVDIKYRAGRESTVWERVVHSNFLFVVIISCITGYLL